MAAWIDLFSLFVTIGVFGGTIYGVVYMVKQISESVKSTKEKMREKGYDISNKGVSIKTKKRFDREDYVDATQRSMMKAMTATSFNRRTNSTDGTQLSGGLHSNSITPTSPEHTVSFTHPADVKRADSGGSAKSAESNGSKKKRGLFGSKKNSI